MVVLEPAGVVELDRHRPIKALLIHGFQPASQPAHGSCAHPSQCRGSPMDLTARGPPGSSGGVSVAGGGHAFLLAVSAEGVEPDGHYIE
jgi:hypothetical protein